MLDLSNTKNAMIGPYQGLYGLIGPCVGISDLIGPCVGISDLIGPFPELFDWSIHIRPEIIMQLVAIILFLNSFKILLLFPKALLFSTIVNACYTATFNIVLSEQRLRLRYRQIRVLGQHCQQINYNICASAANVSHYYHVQKLEVNLHHTGGPLTSAYKCLLLFWTYSLPLLLFSKLFWHNNDLRPNTHGSSDWSVPYPVLSDWSVPCWSTSRAF